MVRKRRLAFAIVAVIVVLFGAVTLVISTGVFKTAPQLTPAQLAARAARARFEKTLAVEKNAAHEAESLVAVHLPTKRGSLAPAVPAQLFRTPLSAHEVVGFVPYWGLSDLSSQDIAEASVLVYSSVCVSGDASILVTGQDCSAGLADLSSVGFENLVGNAHQAGDRVLLSVETTDEPTIHALVSHPANRSTKLAAELSALVVAGHLDGVDIDLEGRGTTDRAPFVIFVADLAAALRREIPGGEVMLDAYPQSAAGSSDFFDVAKLEKSVDRIFVMAYQMENPLRSSANSPLTSPVLGWSDVQAVLQYIKVVPAAKIILGLPFYGLNFATLIPTPGSPTTVSDPGARSYSAIAAVDRPAYWDVASETPYTVFKLDGVWHEDWYDNPVSIALKTALASLHHLAGVGAWAFGMEGDDIEMLQALTGGAAPVKLPLVAAGG